MTKFVVLYSGGGEPEDESMNDAVMAAWGAWYGKLGDAIVDGGNPFTPVGKRVAGDGSVSDMAMNEISGYTVIEADSLDAAVAAVKDHPHLNYGGEISVHETFVIPM